MAANWLPPHLLRHTESEPRFDFYADVGNWEPPAACQRRRRVRPNGSDGWEKTVRAFHEGQTSEPIGITDPSRSHFGVRVNAARLLAPMVQDEASRQDPG